MFSVSLIPKTAAVKFQACKNEGDIKADIRKICCRDIQGIFVTQNSDQTLALVTVFFFANLMHKFFILIRLLHSSTRFEHYYAHLQEDNCISTASGIVTLFR